MVLPLIAIIAILIGLLLPAVQKVRDAAANQAGRATSVLDPICRPPLCDALETDTTIRVPLIPSSLTFPLILNGGVNLAYNQDELPYGEIFTIRTLRSEPGTPNSFHVSFPAFVANLPDTDYRFAGGEYDNIGLRLYVAAASEAGPNPFAVRASGDGDVSSIEAEPIPEPAPVVLSLSGLALLAVLRRRR